MSTYYKIERTVVPKGGIHFLLGTKEQVKECDDRILIPVEIYLDWDNNNLIFVPQEGYELPTRIVAEN